MNRPLMTCGHSANAEHITPDGARVPCCCICDVETLAPPTVLDGRVSRCTYCRAEEPSKRSLPFFRYVPLREYDEHYCGCKGWD
jgi:hypothetical protein